MAFKPTYRAIWGISYPLLIAAVSETVVEVTDTAFLARYGLTELAAIGLAGALYALALFPTLGLVDGIQIQAGRRAGEGRPRALGHAFNQGVYLLLIACAPLVVLVALGFGPATAGVFASAGVHGAVDAYLTIAILGLPFNAVSLALSAFYVAIGRTRVLIGATAALAATNIVLDYGLIFGRLGLPELGMTGAALASLAAEGVAFAWLLIHAWRHGHLGTYGLFRLQAWDRPLAGRLVGLSAPVSLEALVETARWFAFFLLIERLGEATLARSNIVFSCYALLLLPVDAFSETVCSMVSNLIGQNRAGELRRFLTRSMRLSFAAVLPLALIAGLFPHAVLGIFAEDPALVAGALGALGAAIAAALIAVPAETYHAALAGTGDTVAVLAIQVAATAVILGWAWTAALPLALPLAAVWIAEAVGWVVILALARARFAGGRWQRLAV